jgi:hypothetical protein
MNVVKMALSSCREKQSIARGQDIARAATVSYMDRVRDAFNLLAEVGALDEMSGNGLLKKDNPTDCIGTNSGEDGYGVLQVRFNELGELTGVKLFPNGLPAQGES